MYRADRTRRDPIGRAARYRQATGSFTLAFLTIPIFMVAMAAGVWLIVPEHAGKELNAIAV